MSQPRFLADHDLNPGLFMVQQTLPIRPVIESIVLIWSASQFEEWKNQVVYLPLE